MTPFAHRLSTYRPVWDAGEDRRCSGSDEDVVTLAVAAASSICAEAAGQVERVVLITRSPDVLEPDPGPVLCTALGLPAGTPVQQRLGGGPATLAALADASPGTLLIAVARDVPASAAAVLTGTTGAVIARPRAYASSLPAVVRAVGTSMATVYDDPRLVRERGTRLATAAVLSGHAPVAVTGLGPSDARRLGADVGSAGLAGAAEPLFALSQMLEAGRAGLLVAVEGAAAAAVEVGPGVVPVVRTERPAVAPAPRVEPAPARIPLSLPAYARAFEAKVGLRAARCACGRLSYPPRALCLACGRVGAVRLEALPRTGEVYTTVTIRTPVPGIPGPYSLAIVALDGVDVRFLVQVTDAPAGSVRIGDRGELVFRRVATREGVPDYGYAFRPAGQAR